MFLFGPLVFALCLFGIGVAAAWLVVVVRMGYRPRQSRPVGPFLGWVLGILSLLLLGVFGALYWLLLPE